jgi:hypothetical protein
MSDYGLNWLVGYRRPSGRYFCARFVGCTHLAGGLASTPRRRSLRPRYLPGRRLCSSFDWGSPRYYDTAVIDEPYRLIDASRDVARTNSLSIGGEAALY